MTVFLAMNQKVGGGFESLQAHGDHAEITTASFLILEDSV